MPLSQHGAVMIMISYISHLESDLCVVIAVRTYRWPYYYCITGSGTGETDQEGASAHSQGKIVDCRSRLPTRVDWRKSGNPKEVKGSNLGLGISSPL